MSKAVIFFAQGLEECEALLCVDILRRAGVEVTIAAVGGERIVTSARQVNVVADALAELKAIKVSRSKPGFVIGSDQTLEFEGKLYDKAETVDGAAERLRTMRGKPHKLHSAVVVAKDGAPIWREIVSATLTMRDFSDEFLASYLELEGEEALGSVGCYRLEGPGAQLFSKIEGDYFAILGLPLMGLLDLFRRHGVLAA